VNGCQLQTVDEIQPEVVRKFLTGFCDEGKLGLKTYNHYLQAFGAFCNWLVNEGRILANPISSLKPRNAEVDIRHQRRALTQGEFAKLVASARNSREVIQCFDGEQRAQIYILSFMTGLRRKEIASLTPASFDLEGKPPTLTLEAACSKHRKEDELALHPELVTMLSGWLRGLPRHQPLFPNLAKRRTWLMVKKDLARVGIAYETDQGIADFHAAGRHSHITGLFRAGVSLPEARKLARHADVRMTMKYTHVELDDQAKAIEKMECQWIGSVSGVPGCPSVSPNDSGGKKKTRVKKRHNPGGDQGYDANCLTLSPAVADDEKWRRRACMSIGK